MTYVIEAQGVCKEYGSGEGRVEALRGIDLGVSRGEFLAIMGPSGSGKSTLLNVLSGVEPVTTGRVFFEGRDLALLGDGGRTLLRRKQLGFIFQSFNLLPTLSAEENVSLPLLLDGMKLAEATAPSPRSLGRRGPGPPAKPPAEQALRRRAAAGGDRPGAGDPAGRRAGRRADRQPRQRQRPAGDEVPAATGRPRASDDRPDHARCRGSRPGPSRCAPARRIAGMR